MIIEIKTRKPKTRLIPVEIIMGKRASFIPNWMSHIQIRAIEKSISKSVWVFSSRSSETEEMIRIFFLGY